MIYRLQNLWFAAQEAPAAMAALILSMIGIYYCLRWSVLNRRCKSFTEGRDGHFYRCDRAHGHKGPHVAIKMRVR